MVHNSEFEWGRYDRNKPKCSVFEPAPMNFNWTEVLRVPHFLSLAWCEQLGNWPWKHSKMNYTFILHWIVDEPTQGSKTDQAQKMGHGSAIRKTFGACDTPKINASVEGENWGSTPMELGQPNFSVLSQGRHAQMPATRGLKESKALKVEISDLERRPVEVILMLSRRLRWEGSL